MPPDSSPGLLDRPARSAGDRAARVRFRRAIALMLMTLVLPGSAQLVAGNRKVGRIAMRIWFVPGRGTLLAVAGRAALARLRLLDRHQHHAARPAPRWC